MRKKLSLEMQLLQHRYPILAVGFVGGGNEFMVSLWLVDFRLRWGY